MSSKFRKVKLCEILSFKTGKLDSNAAVDNGCYPFFTCSPVTLSINTHAFDTEAVLLAGNNANGVFSVKYHNGKFNAYQRTYVITPLDNSAVNVKWLYFRIKYVTSELQSMSVGTATKFLTKKILDSFEIELPTFEEQTYQAQILWALQDKLANNEAINQTLEQMAQALFKSWFVDFEPVKAKMAALEAGGSQEDATRAAMTAISGKDADALVVFAREHPEQYAELKATAELFPSAVQESELGAIPKGWGVASISEMGKITCGKTPSKKEPKYYGGDVPFIKIPDMHGQLFVLKTNEYLSEVGSKSQLKKLVPANSICVSCIATIGVVSITNEPSHT
ncbi:restriction endonuclease subunit S, partial [Escherichia coli]|nr:restriction endonuclease subunit S [Escherichia coli]